MKDTPHVPLRQIFIRGYCFFFFQKNMADSAALWKRIVTAKVCIRVPATADASLTADPINIKIRACFKIDVSTTVQSVAKI